MILAVPVIDQHALTMQLLDSLDATVVDGDSLHVIVVDNGSAKPYSKRALKTASHPYRVTLVTETTNRGYYQALRHAAEVAATDSDLIGLIHNDLIVYEQGWDRRLREQFVSHGHYGMIGWCGSNEIDENGGRGGGTMCWFRGEKGQSQAAGLRIDDLRPALILDSLFMVMWRAVYPALGVDEHTALCHFEDKRWPLLARQAGWLVGVLGVEIDHLGGQTAVGDNRYPADAREWCLREGVDPGDDPGLALYLEAERRFLDEARRQGRLPSRV